jgi:thiopurine S-methyltransferase
MNMDWLTRWESGQTGWHQPGGNALLRKFWPGIAAHSRVLVPLCGKSSDLLWLAQQGCAVTGVELSEIAVRSFFSEAGIGFEFEETRGLAWFRGIEQDISIVCGDYFHFSDQPFDALYDRAALVALPADIRPRYIQHTKSLLKPDATQLLVTLEYDQSKGNGPPFSVMAEEVKTYWPVLRRVDQQRDSENIPPKFRDAGISEMLETVWST